MDTDYSLPGPVHCQVGVAPSAVRRVSGGNWLGFVSRNLPIEALIRVVRKIDFPIGHGEVAATVFVDPGAHIIGLGSQILGLSIQPPADNDAPAALRRPGFQPVNPGAFQNDAAEPQRLGYDGGG